MQNRVIKRVLYANAWWNQDILNGTMKHAVSMDGTLTSSHALPASSRVAGMGMASLPFWAIQTVFINSLSRLVVLSFLSMQITPN